MDTKPFLLPAPQRLVLGEGMHRLQDRRLILLAHTSPQGLRFAGLRFLKTLEDRLELTWELAASTAIPAELVGLTLRVAPRKVTPAQGYKLEIRPEAIYVDAHDEAGAFYAVCTLIQLIEQYGAELPCLSISDWPDFPARGVLLDISRDKVPTMETLYGLIDMLAGWKINQVQLYMEHTFSYRNHPQVWEKASPLTGQEILELDAYCRARHVELVPNQNSFGHMRRWLKHPRYSHLSELIGTWQAPWGVEEGSFSLCPIDPGSLELVSSLFDELLPHFSSRMVNVGLDETFDLGQGRSKELCQEYGVGKVYFEFFLQIHQNIKARGRMMQYWGDIVLHHPEFIPALPKDAIALDWGYEADYDFPGHAAAFATAGVPFYVCPGTSSWNSISGRSDNALRNCLRAAESGLQYGAVGYLNTDWGDNGHWQPLPVSFLGFAAGAAYSWAVEENRSLDIPEALNRFAFHDQAGVLGCLAYELGNMYQESKLPLINTTPPFLALQWTLLKLQSRPAVLGAAYKNVLEAIDHAILPLAFVKLDPKANPWLKGELVVREFELAARMLRHGCWRGLLANGVTSECPLEEHSPADNSHFRQKLLWDLDTLMEDYTDVWLSRNRPGGLEDSLKPLKNKRGEYLGEEVTPVK